MTYRYAAYVLGITKAFNKVWRITDEAPDQAQPYIDQLKVLARAQYKILARQRHPDLGGSDEQMTELNLALDCLEMMEIPEKITPCPPIIRVRVTQQHSGTSTSNSPFAEAPFIYIRYTKRSD